MAKYEIEREEYADGSEKFYILMNGKRAIGLLGYELVYYSEAAARQVVANSEARDRAKTLVKKEIIK